MKVLQQDEISRDKWNQLLASCSFASPFQTPEYFDLVDRNETTAAEVIALEDSGQLKVLMVITIMKEPGFSGFFSRRGIIFGGPLINETTNEELSFFLSELGKQLKQKVIYLETRNFFDYSAYKDAFISSGWEYKSYVNVQINLTGVKKEEIQSKFKYNRRREIKQSQAAGATYHLSENREEIYSVYQILQQLYLENVKLPLPPFDFFSEFFRTGILLVFVVMHNQKIIGGSFCPVSPGKGLYTYYYCGLRNYDKQIFPTHLAILAALEYAVDNNIPKVDFMGAGKPEVEYGVRNYKLEFGGDLVEHGRYLKILSPLLYNVGKLGLNILKFIR